jgi:lysophospholipase L1-like esterase
MGSVYPLIVLFVSCDTSLNFVKFIAMKTLLFLLLGTLVTGHLHAKPEGAGPIWERGDFGALHEKLASGQSVHLAFLGGSITQNPDGHVSMVANWLQHTYPEAKLTITNAGLSSTCSTSGAFRLERDILSKGAVDLLIVEFAVNDDQDAGHSHSACIRGMEGIVRAALQDNPNTEILIVYFVNEAILECLQEGNLPLTISAHEEVAKRYGITAVSVAHAVAKGINSGKFTWEDYGGVHPKAFGYRLASDLIIRAIDRNRGASGEAGHQESCLPEPIDQGNFSHVELMGPKTASHDSTWIVGPVCENLLPKGTIRRDYRGLPVLRGEQPGTGFKLEFTGRAIGAMILAGPDAGIVETRIDNGEWQMQNLYHHYSSNLNYPRTVLFAEGLEPGDHRLDLRIVERTHPESLGHAVSILDFTVLK